MQQRRRWRSIERIRPETTKEKPKDGRTRVTAPKRVVVNGAARANTRTTLVSIVGFLRKDGDGVVSRDEVSGFVKREVNECCYVASVFKVRTMEG